MAKTNCTVGQQWLFPVSLCFNGMKKLTCQITVLFNFSMNYLVLI